jgi:hypothetical protein
MHFTATQRLRIQEAFDTMDPHSWGGDFRTDDVSYYEGHITLEGLCRIAYVIQQCEAEEAAYDALLASDAGSTSSS